ncbi:tetratricopeptide (TPR) repeat protein [Microbacterium testaceum]|uniref:tetratricopeptide repeat protein n=1 Tax=Microbacterium TaxID=33882 RepID=UPI00278701A4|nr:tetratricopeptide repeat protein [Microbacterium testaceum]MDQ1174464.1 tetratricopeptide (TPR) repeat protein [Microbacterium testaceum]
MVTRDNGEGRVGQGDCAENDYLELVRRVRAAGLGDASHFSNSGILLSPEVVDELRRAEDTPSALFALGAHVWGEEGSELEAIEIFRSASLLGSLDALKALGVALNWMGAHEGAVTWLRQALEKEPDNPQLHGLLGESLLALGQLEPAEPHLRSALIDPSFYMPLARIVQLRGDMDEYRRLVFIASDADVYGSHILAGNILSDCGDLDGAKCMYQRGIETDDAHSAFNLATIYYSQGELSLSEEMFRRAREMGDLRVSPFDDFD